MRPARFTREDRAYGASRLPKTTVITIIITILATFSSTRTLTIRASLVNPGLP